MTNMMLRKRRIFVKHIRFIQDTIYGGQQGVFEFTSETPPDTHVKATLDFWIHEDDIKKITGEIKNIIVHYSI